MQNILAAVAAVILVVGCRQSSEPVIGRPTERELVGTWTLLNSPRGPAGSPALPKSNNSNLLLSSNSVARLTGVLVEEETFRDGKPPIIQWRQKTGSGSWVIDQWLRANDAPLWRVRITLEGNQEMLLQINNRNDGTLELRYRPDPEMVEPFIFVKDGAVPAGK